LITKEIVALGIVAADVAADAAAAVVVAAALEDVADVAFGGNAHLN